MSFGQPAAKSILSSVASLKAQGCEYPVLVVGDSPVSGYPFAEWKGESPFDDSKPKKFRFRAGRVKPFLARYSPWDYTLYVDADTTFMKPIDEAFKMLETCDLVVTQEILNLGQLYNMKLAGWELNIIERDTTVVEIGGDSTQLFVNSGVFLFKKNQCTLKLFDDWHAQWMRFQEWDEQLAFMRAIHMHSDVTTAYLTYKWNSPHKLSNIYIFHPYGRGSVRSQ